MGFDIKAVISSASRPVVYSDLSLFNFANILYDSTILFFPILSIQSVLNQLSKSIITRYWYSFSLLAVPTQTEAAQN